MPYSLVHGTRYGFKPYHLKYLLAVVKCPFVVPCSLEMYTRPSCRNPCIYQFALSLVYVFKYNIGNHKHFICIKIYPYFSKSTN